MKLTGFESASIDPATARELRFAVEEFNAEYCAVLDSGEIEQWPDFFTEDAVYRITARENADAGNVGTADSLISEAAIRAMYRHYREVMGL